MIPTDPYWIQAFEAIMHTSGKLGDELVILEPIASNTDLYATSSEDLVELVLAQDLDVLITTLSNQFILQDLVCAGLPVICLSELDLVHPRLTAMSSLYEGGKIAGKYVAEQLQGRGHAICVTAGLEQMWLKGQSRTEGFHDFLKAFPEISFDEIPAYWSYSEAYPSLLKKLETYPRHIDGFFGVSDTLALAARDAGYKLGIFDERTVKIGLNGDPMALASVAEGTLTATVDTASEKIGAKAMQLAHQIIQGEKQPAIIMQYYQLITRGNVANIATRKLSAIADIPTHMVGHNRRQERDRLAQLEASTEISRIISSLTEQGRLVPGISEVVHSHYGYDWLRVLRWSDKDQSLIFYEGSESPASQKVPINDDLLLLHVFQQDETVFIPDTRTSLRWQMGKEWESIRSRAVLPIHLGEKLIGVLDLQASQPVRPASMEIVGLKLLASQLGIVVQNADLYLEALHAREVAERANQLKTRLVANVGHEMRTPLNAILGFSQTIQMKIQKGEAIHPDDLYRDLSHIYKSGEHLMFMINDLLDLSRAEIGALSLYFELVQPAPLLREVFGEFSQQVITSSGLEWVLEIPEQLPAIRVDVVRLRQVLNNLLVNAKKFTRHGVIALGAAVELPFLHFWVRDTGSGVPIDLQAKIFEPFGIVGRNHRPEGIGLGLSITRHLVNLHGGIITLESQAGKGSTFHVYLPLPGLAQELNGKEFSTSAAVESHPELLIFSGQEQLPAEIGLICRTHNLEPRLISQHSDLSSALAEGLPVAVAWDLGHASVKEWSMLSRLSAGKDYAALPVILFGANGGGKPDSAGYTNIVYKPCQANVFVEWIELVDTGSNLEGSILVVDDDPQARVYYGGLLRKIRPQSQILYAENGIRALESLNEEIPSLILLDLMMPEMDGFTVLDRLRSDDRTRCVPVVIISGKLLDFEDIQRLNYFKTTFYTKGILTDEEAVEFLGKIDGDDALPQPTSIIIKQSLAFLHQNYRHSISRKEVAAAVGVSENYLSQLFRQETSISLTDYLNRLRIQKARLLLRETNDWSHKLRSRWGITTRPTSAVCFISKQENHLLNTARLDDPQ